ncbi:hypothetical protein [Mesorhizobium sp.]|uniref:hypothetical protein n=1 Tax=Mesorhizobium sp. TaxID=1871066 RepID=UPI000FEAA160|nr:hypothetical protein [Mesorhizobium sp.]RWK57860.1 MAG: hypothetical protein EOR48_01610 [Mesorhizobium sp.]RWK83342.1 MAG: hypothetical protein EOR45_31365 [Mesorhizobium sp.]TIP39363.1 MAG: hypothetical protein E5X62_31480 [Mesorhizobium sp.]
MFNKVFPQLDTSTSRHFRDWWCSNEVVNGRQWDTVSILGLMLAANFGIAGGVIHRGAKVTEVADRRSPSV